MNSNKTTFVLVALVVIMAVLYVNNRTRDIQTSLTSLNRERDELNRQIKNLSRQVADLQQRETATSASVEAPPAAHPAAPPPVVQRVEPVATPGVTIKAPKGWAKNGSKTDAYVVGVDTTQSFNGLPSAYVKSLEPSVDGFGGMMQTTSAENFAGKRVRLSGWMKTQDANDGGGHLWLRVDGEQAGRSLQFDNMNGRAAKGTTDWQPYSVVLDVPREAAALAYGFFVEGTGQAWVNGTKIEEVGPEVPSTNMLKNRQPALPKTPTNINFVE